MSQLTRFFNIIKIINNVKNFDNYIEVMDKKYSIIIYFLTQLITFIAVITNLQKQQKQEIMASLIVLMLITMLLYACTALTNEPGYVTAPNTNKQLKQIQHEENINQQTFNDRIKEEGSANLQNISSMKNSTQSKNCKYCLTVLKLRQKHCRQCDKCVATFDHHCPFFNNCIGQFNRPIFYFFLLSQTIQIVVNLCHIMQNQFQNGRTEIGILIFSALLILGFLSGTLLTYHTWLMIVNSTTWQVLRASKIWYINPQIHNQEEEQIIAPLNNLNNANLNLNTQVFYQNIITNILVYWRALCRSQPIDWQPYYQPNTVNQQSC